MPLDTLSESRWSVPGVGRPYLRSKLPNASKDILWRKSVGNVFAVQEPTGILPEGRDFRPRFGSGYQFGRGYRFGYGASDPFYADPNSGRTNPYVVDGSGVSIGTIETLLKTSRWSVPGVGRVFLRSHYPNTAKDEAWRKNTGLSYAKTAESVDLDPVPETITPSEETASTPTYTEETV